MDILSNFEVYLSDKAILSYIIAFLGGVLASFTPCVYPLLPVTIGYIGSRSLGSKIRGFLLSLIYVLGFATFYSLMGALGAISGRLFGEWLQHPLSYILVGSLCLIFSLSLFEVFNLSLPKFLVTRPIKIKIGGFLNTFFVGLISASVASPCTLPIFGSILLFVVLEKDLFFGMSLLFVFSYGMGTLLILAGTFSGILANLPKSGKWMNKIKKFFAWFLLLVAGFYFLKAGRLI